MNKRIPSDEQKARKIQVLMRRLERKKNLCKTEMGAMYQCYFTMKKFMIRVDRSTELYALLQPWIPHSQNLQKLNISKHSVNAHRTSPSEILSWVNKFKTHILTLKIQGISFRFAWMTSEAKTELTENSSSLVETINIIAKELNRVKSVYSLLLCAFFWT